jgi:hypothetical protein
VILCCVTRHTRTWASVPRAVSTRGPAVSKCSRNRTERLIALLASRTDCTAAGRFVPSHTLPPPVLPVANNCRAMTQQYLADERPAARYGPPFPGAAFASTRALSASNKGPRPSAPCASRADRPAEATAVTTHRTKLAPAAASLEQDVSGAVAYIAGSFLARRAAVPHAASSLGGGVRLGPLGTSAVISPVAPEREWAGAGTRDCRAFVGEGGGRRGARPPQSLKAEFALV